MQHADILALAGLRVDGRRGEDIRSIRYKIGVSNSNSADGSCYFEQGLNKVLVLVHGPQEPQRRVGMGDNERGVIECHIVQSPFSGIERKKRRPGGDKKSLEMEAVVKQTIGGVICLELYPRSEINIVVHVLETDGSILCSILNAISMACMDAGILMSDMVVSCSAGLIKQQICQDLTYVEQTNGAFIPIAIKARSQEVLHMQLDSRLTISNLEGVMSSAIDGCKKIKDIIELGIKISMTESLISNNARR